MRDDELRARLLATFLGELHEQVAILNAELIRLESEPSEPEPLAAIFRIFHTIKGASRVTGFPLIEELCHLLEIKLVEIRDGSGDLDSEWFRLLYSAADVLEDAAQRIRAEEPLLDSPLTELLSELDAESSSPADTQVRHEVVQTTTRAPRALEAITTDELEEPVRIQPGELDRLQAMAGDLMVTTGRLARWPTDLDDLQDRLNLLRAEWRRLSPGLHRALQGEGGERDLGEVVRHLDEGVRSITSELSSLARRTADDSRALSMITEGVTEMVHHLRLRPFGDACQALPRAVRDVASIAGKEVDLVVEGQEIRVDRAVIDALREPLLHLIRNAVDHGIERPATRSAAGKPRRGRIDLVARLVGGRFTVQLSDDGAGLDLEAIRARLEERGLEVAQDERLILEALFAGGLSTRREVTTISGRGVGLNLVRTTLERIGGSVELTWTPGKGTTFTLECPPTPARIRTLLVMVSAQTFAVPTAHVDRLIRLDPEEIRYVEGRPVVILDGEPLPFAPLAAILGSPLTTRPPTGRLPIVILRSGDSRVAIAVDDLIAEEELALRPLERGRNSLPFISGGALLPSGEAVLVINPVGVVAAGSGLGEVVEFTPTNTSTGTQRYQRILVVDDSITTRTLEQSVLEAAGYEVLTAADGARAWQILQEEIIDLVVADIEMPQMDGFELTEVIRNSRRLRELPVVLVTALESAEDRARGLEAGADAYLIKSGFDQETLLDTIRQLLG